MEIEVKLNFNGKCGKPIPTDFLNLKLWFPIKANFSLTPSVPVSFMQYEIVNKN